MKLLVERWYKAGLLDPPFRPDDVPPISPVPHPNEVEDILSPEVQAEIAEEFNEMLFYGEENVMLGGVMGGPGMEPVPDLRPPPVLPPETPPPAPSTPPGEGPTNRPTTNGRPITRSRPIRIEPRPGGRPGVGPPILAVGIPVALAVAPHLAAWWFKRSHPEYDWQGKTNPITGRPVESLAEYQWLQGLTESQLGYLRVLYDAQSLYPDPAGEEPDPLAKPDATVQAAISAASQEQLEEQEQGRRRRRRRCIQIHVPRPGKGHLRHDSYAMTVSLSPLNMDYYVHTGGLLGYGIAYDALTPGTNLVWEVKTGYGFLFNADYPGLQKLMKWENQKERGLYIANRCNLRLYWSIGAGDPSKPGDVTTARLLAAALNRVWKGAPPVFSLPG